MKKSWFIGLSIAWVVIIGIVAVAILDSEESIAPPEVPLEEVVEEDVEKDVEDDIVVEELTQTTCEVAGGSWEACGSMCRGQDADVCIELCATYCECETSEQCPSGYACDEYVDGVGICL